MIYILVFMLGVLLGFGCSVAFFLGAIVDKSSNPADNVVRNLKRFADSMAAEKGAIIYPKSEDMIAMEETFAMNDKEGIDTPVGEIEGHEQM